MDATEYLQAKIKQMKHDATNFETAMKRTPVADSKPALRPPRERVTVRKSTTDDAAASAAEYLAYINGPINSTDEKG